MSRRKLKQIANDRVSCLFVSSAFGPSVGQSFLLTARARKLFGVLWRFRSTETLRDPNDGEDCWDIEHDYHRDSRRHHRDELCDRLSQFSDDGCPEWCWPI